MANRRLTGSVGGLLLALLLICDGSAVWAQDVQRKVLVLYSTGRDTAISRIGERELPRLLDAGLDRRLDYHSEYIDGGRFPDPAYRRSFADFLRVKYAGVRFDLIIAMQDVAIRFLEEYQGGLFPNLPVVFIARDGTTKPLPNSTGVFADVDLAATITLARALHTGLKQVFVVTGAGARDRAYERLARSQLQQFEPQLTFTYLAGLPTPELERRLSALPADAIVYYLLVYEDGAGDIFLPVEYAARVAARANRPTYSWVDSTLDQGVVGGSLQRLSVQVAAVAELALRVLHGEPADGIPPMTSRLDALQVDWRQLQRWGISDTRVPAGTEILFREPGAWQRYKPYILGASVIVVAQTGLIVGLLVQGMRRKRAEEEVRRGQEQLQRTSDQIRDLAGRLLNAQEDERGRLARELHDDVGQQLALLTMDLQALTGFEREFDAEAETVVREALARTDAIAKSLHELSHRLHPQKLRLIGLVAALNGLSRELSGSDRAAVAVTFVHEQVPASLPHDLALCLFRVAQEAVQNAIKHSGAGRISIALSGGSSELSLSVVDDGRGFHVQEMWGKGLGLMSMSERIESLGGTLAIHSSPGGGTCIVATAPLPVGEAPPVVTAM